MFGIFCSFNGEYTQHISLSIENNNPREEKVTFK